MGIIYPDNQNRVNRVQQFATNIGQIQSNIKQYVDGVHKQNNRTLPMLDRISKRAGFRTLEEYLQDAVKKMTAEEREQYENMKKDLEGHDLHVDVALKVGTGLLAVGIAVRYGAPLMAKLFSSTLMQLSIVAIARGVVLVISGSVNQGMALIRGGTRAVRYVMDVGKVGATVSKALRYIKLVSKTLAVIGLVIDGFLIGWELYEGAEQKRKLQSAIFELCCRRFSVKKIEQGAWVTQLFASDAKSLVELQDDLDEDIAEGETTEEKAKKKMERKIQRIVDQLSTSMGEITDETVWEKLGEQDKNSGISWTEDDPSLKQVEEWLEKHQNEKD